MESLLPEMDKNVSLLEELRDVSREQFVRDPKVHLFAERCFQLAIQCLVDSSYRLAADDGWPKPQDSAAALKLLVERGVLPSEFGRKIEGMVSFRDVLVHAYLHIDRSIVHSKLAEISDFRAYQRHVLQYLTQRQKRGS
ncbi:MAG TPA: DUF86 domain-containing protein [Planctomycetota bacterium]|nr:DUF86 domain-containing protein [Planctomycetota bacterium]